ncbi:unnamed protein product, partial [Strongylus vulgaris]
ISPVTPAHAGTYTAVAVNEYGESYTSATLIVQPTTTTKTVVEDMLQEDTFERLGRPKERTEEVVREELKYEEKSRAIPQPHDTSKSVTEKRWVELIEEQMSQPSPIPEPISVTTEKKKVSERRWVDLIEEQMSQPSPIPEPISVTTEKKKVSERRWVDQIDEILQQATQREVQTAETYVKMVDELMRDALPQTEREATRTVTTEEYAQQIHQAPRPEVETSTTTKVSLEAYHAGKIDVAPQPEVQTSTTTQVAETYHAGQIHEVQPKVETTTTTQVTTEAFHAGAYYEAVPEVKPEVYPITTEKQEKMYSAVSTIEDFGKRFRYSRQTQIERER